MTATGVPRFKQFVVDFGSLLSATSDEARILEVGAALLRALVAQDDWLPEAFARPGLKRYRQYLLHLDPRRRFSVVSFVWGPGQATPVHDHTVWGLVGMLRGAELSQAFDIASGSVRPIGSVHRLCPGEVEAVSPTIGDVHQVSNALADATSVSIHVYGADIGRVCRSTYDAQGRARPFISGYSNGAGRRTQLRSLWQCPVEAHHP